MSIADLQSLIGVNPDGVWGNKSQAVLAEHFSNREANGLNETDFVLAAGRLGCSVAQIKAVRRVEAAASGFDAQGRPKILFERHKFHRFTGGRFSVCYFSNPKGGGYGADSWEKLNGANRAVLRLRGTSTNAARAVSVEATDGTEKAFIRGDGRYYGASSAYFETGVRFSTSSGTLNDRGIFVGSGSPESVVTANPGSLYLNTAGGASTTLYVKESGGGNTGWIAK